MGGYMLHSVTITVLALGILLVVALPASYCLARFKFVGGKFLNTCFMAGLFINVNYIVVPIYLMLSDGDKWLKGVLGSTFLLNNHIVVAVVYAATALPFTIYLLSSYFATLPHDFEEAAYIDGAGPFKTFIKIAIPSSTVVILTVSVFSAIWHWNDYYLSTMYITSNYPLAVRLANINETLRLNNPFTGGAATAMINSVSLAACILFILPLLIAYLCVQNKFVKSIDRVGITG